MFDSHVETIKFLSTPSARRATQKAALMQNGSMISIHALREEGDDDNVPYRMTWDISIHALREEGDRSHQ